MFAASDAMAFGAIRAIAEAGLRVPDDVAVVGFDGIEEDDIEQFSLSTVDQPVQGLGREAINALMGLIAHPDAAPIQRFLPTRLTLRGSCGCAAPHDQPVSDAR